MKNLIIVSGTMGVGKTTVCRILHKRLDRCVFLDGDWCWYADPFIITAETKRMVLGNISHMLESFIRCTEYRNILFCWMLHEVQIWRELYARLPLDSCRTLPVALTCQPEALQSRIQGDVASGLRGANSVEHSIVRLPLYRDVPAHVIDTTDLSPEQTATRIESLLKRDLPIAATFDPTQRKGGCL
ncbi:MAG: AAA family ATPase [Clostridia bacterium]|nr:AAA family ATPase [Clostridia bacterium]